MPHRATWRRRLEPVLLRLWFRRDRTLAAQFLRPLSWLYGAVQRLLTWRSATSIVPPLPVPLIVVGNLIIGGAGKTPTVIAIVGLLQSAGWRPGVISRGYGRSSDDVRAVSTAERAVDVGDEPLLIRRRTGVPCFVGADRRAAAEALLHAHREVEVLVSDDGLQHRALPRQVEILVFDERGLGNGLLLPAGPLRQRVADAVTASTLVLYNDTAPSTDLSGHRAQARLGDAVPLAQWMAGTRASARALHSLRGTPLLAVAGMAHPERFFVSLEDAGLSVQRCPLPDHFDYASSPWPVDAPMVLVTEKDAVKLDPAAPANRQVWVVGLDLQLPSDFARLLLQRLGPRDNP